MLLQFIPQSELNLIEQSSSPRKSKIRGGGIDVGRGMEKEIALIYLPLIGEDRYIVPSGLKCTPSAN